MLEIVGKSDIQHGDGFWVECKECGQETKNEFLSDPMDLRFKATCSECGESREFRFNITQWEGRP